MAPFTPFTSRVVPLLVDNVDTDQIIPARFLKATTKDGMADGLFADWRRDPGFVLNRAESAGAQVLLAGDNFGCGSSREHAPWALRAWGFRAVVAPSFADIFHNNALKNGLLPVKLEAAAHAALTDAYARAGVLAVSIDLATQTLALADGRTYSFPVEPFAKHCLLHGVDELGYLLTLEPEIAAYESRRTA